MRAPLRSVGSAPRRTELWVRRCRAGEGGKVVVKAAARLGTTRPIATRRAGIGPRRVRGVEVPRCAMGGGGLYYRTCGEGMQGILWNGRNTRRKPPHDTRRCRAGSRAPVAVLRRARAEAEISVFIWFPTFLGERSHIIAATDFA